MNWVVSTFSVGYEEQDYSELQAAAGNSRLPETDHEEYIITPGEYWDNLPHWSGILMNR